VRDDVDINRPELVYGTHQRKLPVGCEIAEVENTQGAEGKENSERTAVLALVCRILLAAIAGRILLAASGDRLGDDSAVSADYGRVDSLDGQGVSGLEHQVFVLLVGEDGFVGLDQRIASRSRRLTVFAMVDERADRDRLHQFCHAAYVVLVVMRDEYVINFGEASFVRKVCDTLGRFSRPASIDEQ